MIKEILYTYLGTNGTLTTTIELEGVPAIKRIRLTAEYGKKLTDGNQRVDTVTVKEEDVKKWIEVKK